MGLKLKLKPFEKFVVNGVVIENGRHRNTVTVANHAQVMTGRAIMQAEDATTPARRAYYAIQALLLDPAGAAERRPACDALMGQLRDAIRDPAMAAQLREAQGFIDGGDPYKALAALRPVMAYEAALLEPAALPGERAPAPRGGAMGLGA